MRPVRFAMALILLVGLPACGGDGDATPDVASADIRTADMTMDLGMDGQDPPDVVLDMGGDDGGTSVDAFRAFPEAEGYGAMALTGCNRDSVQVLQVTNLDGSGEGSLDQAIRDSDPERLTVVVFRVTGDLRQGTRVERGSGCLYIAGQTAPGGGVQFDTAGVSFTVSRDGPNDVAVRYLRFRSRKSDGQLQDVVDIYGGERIIFDHTSSQFGNDEVFSIHTVDAADAADIRQVTVQHTIIAAGLVPHSTGTLIDPAPGSSLTDITMHHNLYTENSHRTPFIGGYTDRIQVINNVTYNYKGQPSETTRRMSTVDFIGNYWVPGPWSRADRPVLHHMLGESELREGVLFVEGNVHLGRDPDEDQRELFRFDGSSTDDQPDYARLPDTVFRGDPSGRPEVSVNIQGAETAYESILAQVGASRRIDCDGSWIDNRDDLDERLITRVRDRTGEGGDENHDDPSDHGGTPTLDAGEPCPDGDGDGMPDAFEARYGVDDISADPDGDGYTNIEEWINGTRPRR